MAATGKKSKKAKWIPASITDIIAEPTTIPTANSWAESADDEPETSYGGYSSRPRAPVVLPSASRAARGGMAVDDESIPKRPPYIAHISNLPYDVDESAITELFEGLKIINLRLPRESDRLKGYGYVDFEDRESLINAMNMPDLTISGRRIRIGVSTQENDRRMGRGGRNDRERDYDPERTMGDWRSGPRAVPEPQRARDPERAPRPVSERDRERDSSADNRPGGWRDGERAAPEPARTPYGGRDSFGRDRGYGEDRGRERSGYGGRDGFRTAERDGFGSRDSRGFGGRGFGDRDRDPPKEEARAAPRERPKLNLLPRTVPRDAPPPGRPADGADADDKPAPPPKPVPAEKVFGAAKPVDTAAKEREIEERLLKQEEESRRAVEEKDRWGRRNDHSGDRRGGARRDDRDRGRDDRGRDSRSYNRDRRDYSKEGKDDRERRDYSKDDRERRDYGERDRRDYRDERDRRDTRDERDRRDYKDDKDRRDYSSRDSRDRRSYSGSRRDSRSDDSRSPRRSGSPPRRNGSAERSPARSRAASRDRDDRPDTNGRARDRDVPDDQDRDDKLPKMKDHEKPNFVASNKFSFLEDADDGGSD